MSQETAQTMAGTTPAAQDPMDEVLDTACQLLMKTRAPVPVAALAEQLRKVPGHDPETVAAVVARHEARGRMALNADGQVITSAGLSVAPDKYEIVVGELRLWAVCAKTALGFVAALGRGGQVVSRSPSTGAWLRIEFTGSRPTDERPAVFWPSNQLRSSCSSLATQFCPTFSLFEDSRTARSWAAAGEVPGEVLPVAEATERAAAVWRESFEHAAALAVPSKGEP
jgi:hypothetical protein